MCGVCIQTIKDQTSMNLRPYRLPYGMGERNGWLAPLARGARLLQYLGRAVGPGPGWPLPGAAWEPVGLLTVLDSPNTIHGTHMPDPTHFSRLAVCYALSISSLSVQSITDPYASDPASWSTTTCPAVKPAM